MAEAPIAIHQVPAPGGGLIVVLPGPAARAAGIFPESTGLYLVTDQGGVNLEECSDPDTARLFADEIAAGRRMWGRRLRASRALIQDPARRYEEVLAAVSDAISPEFYAQKLKSLASATKWVKTGPESYEEVVDASAVSAFLKHYADMTVGTATPRVPVEGEKTQTLSLEALLDQPAVRELLLMRLLDYPEALATVMAKISAMGIASDSGNSSPR